MLTQLYVSAELVLVWVMEVGRLWCHPTTPDTIYYSCKSWFGQVEED